MTRYLLFLLALTTTGCLEAPTAAHTEPNRSDRATSSLPHDTHEENRTSTSPSDPFDAETASLTASPPEGQDTASSSREKKKRPADAVDPFHERIARNQPARDYMQSRRDMPPEPSAWMKDSPDGTPMLMIQAGHTGTHTVGASQILQSKRGTPGLVDGSRTRLHTRGTDPSQTAPAETTAFTDAAKRGEEEYRFLLSMIDAPDPAEVDRVIGIALMPSHPFADLAWHVLGGLDTPATRNAIRTTLQGDNVAQQCAALGALLRLAPQEATRHARRMLRDPTPDLRLAALTVLGETRDVASRRDVRDMAEAENPVLRMRVGWVLMELDDPEGARILRSFASTEDPAFAVQAMSILTNRQDADTLPLLYHNLYHKHERIMMTALECIEQYPESARSRALLTIPEEFREMLSNRRLLLLCYGGSFPVSTPILDATRADHPSDRLYALRSLLRHNRTEHLGTLIRLAFDPDPRTQEEARRGVRAWIKTSGLQGAPTEFVSRKAWQQWWFREHRILATAPGQVLLSMPTGETKPFRLGSRLDFDAVVESVRMGYGEDHRKGALVMINCEGQPYSLTP